MLHKPKLDEDKQGKPVYATIYCSIIGSLMNITSSKLDIHFDICMCAHYQSMPKEKHITAVKRIFRYLKGTMYMGLVYPKDFRFWTNCLFRCRLCMLSNWLQKYFRDYLIHWRKKWYTYLDIGCMDSCQGCILVEGFIGSMNIGWRNSCRVLLLFVGKVNQLVFNEAESHFIIYYRSWILIYLRLLCTSSMDEDTIDGLWFLLR